MSLLQSIILGIVQGLTEFLPISSTAHLRIIPALLKWDDPGAAFTAVIQLGTLVAVLWYFRHDIVRIAQATLSALFSGKPLATPDAKMGWLIVVGTIPVVICGLLFKKKIEHDWRSLYIIAGSMIGLAVMLGLAELYYRSRWKRGEQGKSLEQVGWFEAIFIGLWQAVALVPGSSRSGTTITGGLFAGLSRSTAARFSFLLSLPSVFAAAVKELYDNHHELLASKDHILTLSVATVVSGIVGYASIAFLIRFLRLHSTWVFIVYRLALGVILLYLLYAGVLSALPPETAVHAQ